MRRGARLDVERIARPFDYAQGVGVSSCGLCQQDGQAGSLPRMESSCRFFRLGPGSANRARRDSCPG